MIMPLDLIAISATGLQLRAVREAALLTQRDFASEVGISLETLCRLEQKNLPLKSTSLTTRKKIAQALLKLGVRLTETGWEKLEQKQ